MLSFLRGDAEVGFYSAAYRLTDALVFLPSVITTSTFPVMSKYFKDSFYAFSFAYARTFKYLFAAGLLIAVVVTFASDKIIYIVYGSEYQNSVIALQILIWATAIMFINVLISSTCISSGNQQIISKTAILAAVLNVILNADSYPFNWLHRCCDCYCIFSFRVHAIWLILDSEEPVTEKLLHATLSPLIGAGVISLLIILLKSYADILFLSVSSVPVFVIVLYIIGWIDSDDKRIFLKLIPRNRF